MMYICVYIYIYCTYRERIWLWRIMEVDHISVGILFMLFRWCQGGGIPTPSCCMPMVALRDLRSCVSMSGPGFRKKLFFSTNEVGFMHLRRTSLVLALDDAVVCLDRTCGCKGICWKHMTIYTGSWSNQENPHENPVAFSRIAKC